MTTTFSIRALVVEGHLGGVRPGMSRTQVRALLGAPDNATPVDISRARAWNYGNFEVHFEGDNVWMLLNDRPWDIKAGPRRELVPWLTNNYRGLHLASVEHQFKVEGIQFFRGRDDMNRRVLRVFDGAQLTFEPQGESDEVLAAIAVMAPAKAPRFRPDQHHH
jgi:hypothetical protein